MDYETLLYTVSDGVAAITLNRPDVLNGLNGEMRRELTHAFGRAGREARAVLLTGAGRGFCSGQDLGATDATSVDLEALLNEEYAPLLRRIRDCPAPVVCAVNGAAAGAGANLALAADIVIAGRSAYFLQAFSRIGLIPDAGGTYILPRRVGGARAMGMALLGDRIEAERAADWGLIWDVVDDARLMEEATALAGRLARGPSAAHRLAKQALRASLGNDFESQLALEARLQGEAGRTRDFVEGVSAFVEKRAPDFEGR